MTDAEIIKALECCGTDMNCHRCPANENECGCIRKTCQNALDLINRQKAEIEKLRKRVNFVEQANVQLREELKETTEKFNCQQYVYADLSDIIRDKNAEIERLNKEVDRLSQIVLYHDGHIADARAEAIKEFAERLKTEQSFYDGQETRIYLTEKDLDNLVKEMVGDAE